MGVQRRLIAALAAVALAGTLAACGDEDFENNPRPPAPISMSARIGDDGVALGPTEVGAGLANITISNQTDDPATLVLEGPTDESSDEIVAGGTGSLKVALEEGEYLVSTAEDTRADSAHGRPRARQLSERPAAAVAVDQSSSIAPRAAAATRPSIRARQRSTSATISSNSSRAVSALLVTLVSDFRTRLARFSRAVASSAASRTPAASTSRSSAPSASTRARTYL